MQAMYCRRAREFDIILHASKCVHHKFCSTLRASIMHRAVLNVSATEGRESSIVVLHQGSTSAQKRPKHLGGSMLMLCGVEQCS